MNNPPVRRLRCSGRSVQQKRSHPDHASTSHDTGNGSDGALLLRDLRGSESAQLVCSRKNTQSAVGLIAIVKVDTD